MDPDELLEWCLAQPGAVEEFPFGPDHSVLKVGGKMFAITALGREPLEISLKCEPDLAVELRASYDSVRPGYHLNKRHWNTVTIGADVPDGLVRDMVQDSYDLVVSALPAAKRRALGWDRERAPGRSSRR
jgi:predicted DNA-binding protein (MmcQ/YjbR family)